VGTADQVQPAAAGEKLTCLGPHDRERHEEAASRERGRYQSGVEASPNHVEPAGNWSMTNAAVSIGDQVYLEEGGVTFGAVRQVRAHELTVFIEGTGDVTLPAAAVTAVHSGKVIVNREALSTTARQAIAVAHRREEPNT
jgi:hypothetical protein